MLQTSSCNIVYRSEFIKKYRYEENIKYSEDTKFMSILLRDCSKYEIICDSLYNQRKRIENTSVT